MSTDEYVVNKLKQLCEKHHMTRYRIAQITGLSQTTVAHIFMGKSMPTLGTLSILCDAFGISLAQFFSDDEGATGLSEQQRTLLKEWEELTPDKRKMLLKFIDSIR